MPLVARRFPWKFDHLNLNSEDPTQRVAAIDHAIAQAEAWETELQTLYDDINADRMLAAEIQRTTPSPSTEDRANNLGQCLLQIEDGIGSMDGYHDERLAVIVGQPGLARTRAVLAELKAERKAWASRIGQLDAPPAKYRVKKGHQYTECGPEGVRRVYRAGDVVELTANQAKAWADKFEKVEDDPPSRKKPLTADPDVPPGGMRHTTEERLERRARQDAR